MQALFREEPIRELGAAIKYGPEAVAAGLADRTGTLRTALADLAALLRPTSIPQEGRRMKEDTARAEAPEPTIELEALRAEARREGYGEAREIVELCAPAGMPAKAPALLAREMTPAEAFSSGREPSANRAAARLTADQRRAELEAKQC